MITEAFEDDYSNFCSRKRLAVRCETLFKKVCGRSETLKWSQANSKKKKVKEAELETRSLSGDGAITLGFPAQGLVAEGNLLVSRKMASHIVGYPRMGPKRGNSTLPAMEMTKWVDTNYHFVVP